MSVGNQNLDSQRVTDVKDTIFVDSNLLNFQVTLPGKMLGSTLCVGNHTDAEQIIELNVDTIAFSYPKKQILYTFSEVPQFL